MHSNDSMWTIVSELDSAQVRIRLFLLLLGRVVVWSVSRSGRQICCRPILMESSPGIHSICHPLAIRLPVSLPLPSGHGRWSGSCWISIPMLALTHWECFLFFWRRQLWFWSLVLLWYFGGFFDWVAFLFAGEWLMSPQFQRVHIPPQHPIIDQFL